MCLADVTNHVLTDGWPYVKNASPTPATIDKVAMANPHGLKLIVAWAVPITGHTAYGAEPGYPPGKSLAPGVQWAERRNADGAVIPHTKHICQITDLLFVVRLLAKRATASGVDIWYHVGSQHYHFHSPFGLIVLAPGLKCKAG